MTRFYCLLFCPALFKHNNLCPSMDTLKKKKKMKMGQFSIAFSSSFSLRLKVWTLETHLRILNDFSVAFYMHIKKISLNISVYNKSVRDWSIAKCDKMMRGEQGYVLNHRNWVFIYFFLLYSFFFVYSSTTNLMCRESFKSAWK